MNQYQIKFAYCLSFVLANAAVAFMVITTVQASPPHASPKDVPGYGAVTETDATMTGKQWKAYCADESHWKMKVQYPTPGDQTDSKFGRLEQK